MISTHETLELLKQRAIANCRTTNSYAFVDTEALGSAIYVSLESQGVGVVESTTRGSYSCRAKTTKHITTWHLKGLGVPEGHPTLTIVNSFNGEGSLQVRVGFHRLVCSNGLMVGSDWFCSTVRHVKGEKMWEFLSEVDFSVQKAVAWIKANLVDQIGALKSRPIGIEAQLELVEKLNLPAKTKEQVKYRRLHANWYRPEDADQNLWNFYNTVNEVIRLRSRSDLANFNKQSNLLPEILKLAA